MSVLRRYTILGIIAAVLCVYGDGRESSAQTGSSRDVATDGVLASRTYYDGAETIGRVGHEAILRRDIVHQLKKFAVTQYLEEIQKIPEDKREEYGPKMKAAILESFLNSEKLYSQILDNHIRKLLFYNDYVVSRPKSQIEEQTKQLEKEFDAKVVPELMTTFNCKSLHDLQDYYRDELQSDFMQEKRIFLQHTLGELWKNFNLGEEQFDPSAVDLRRYYEANLDEYRSEPRARWQAMTVMFGRKRTKEEATRKIAHMGNAVQSEPDPQKREALFAEVCRVDSEDVFAQNGGYRDWTAPGSLRSEVVEEAIFSETLPVGAMSRILEDASSLTIVRVIERIPAKVKPFSEVQESVREKLIEDRRQAMATLYEEKLSERFSIEIYAIAPDERREWTHTAEASEISASGRDKY
ncbi:MAG: peptidyl-prolyl cis-trans isomerase [Thermoguttaceae bacterium]|nr:peptidyl-prolyl cis-trans isomerase [Thermoguttaceae bacterium]